MAVESFTAVYDIKSLDTLETAVPPGDTLGNTFDLKNLTTLETAAPPDNTLSNPFDLKNLATLETADPPGDTLGNTFDLSVPAVINSDVEFGAETTSSLTTTMTVSNKIEAFPDIAASTSTVSSVVSLFTDAPGGIKSNSSKASVVTQEPEAMVVPSILVMDTWKTQPTVYRMVGCNINYPGSQIGNPFGSVEPLNSGEKLFQGMCNAVIQIGRKIYANVNNEIYMYDEGTPSNDWTLIHSTSSVPDSWTKSGLYPFLINGVVNVGGVTNVDGNNVNAFVINTLTDVATDLGNLFIGMAGSSGLGYASTYVWANRIWIGSQSAIAWVDLLNSTSSAVPVENGLHTNSSVGARQVSFQAWNNELYAAFVDNNGGNDNIANRWVLQRYNRGSNQFETVFTAPLRRPYGASAHRHAKSAMWVQNDMLYLMFRANPDLASGTPSGDDDRFYIYEFDDSGTEIAGVLTEWDNPAGNDEQWYVVVDQESNPGADPDVYLYLKTNAEVTGQLTCYLANGASLTLFDGPRGNSTTTIPRDKAGGSERFWTSDETTIRITSHSITTTGQRFGFIILNGNPTVSYNFQLFYVTDGETPNIPATLSDPSGGTLSMPTPNVLSNLDTDTEYFVTWETMTDGVMETDNVRIVGRVF
ncbi:MAG: hypothetical protein ACXABY_10015 [Candidatus Thorarchaeota archaeon]|jgi:hypothetical protein